MPSDPIQTRELSTVKMAMQISGAHKTPVGRAAHISDGGDAAANATAIAAINVVLENLGLVATS